MASEEHEIQKRIQVALSQHKCSVFRTNVGKVQIVDAPIKKISFVEKGKSNEDQD